jgi:hypothetical protein
MTYPEVLPPWKDMPFSDAEMLKENLVTVNW